MYSYEELLLLGLMNKQPIIENKKIAVLGGGSWGTALVKMLSENLSKIGWYIRNSQTIEYIKTNKHNPNYLTSTELHPESLDLSNDINKIIKEYDVLIFTIPSVYLMSELKKLKEPLENKILFSAIKGIVPESELIIGEHFLKYYKSPIENIGVITGPCHAEEVAMERLSYLTIACKKEENASFLSSKLRSRYIKTKISDDIIGSEYAAMLKNIFAIAAGISHGLGYGDNFQAVLMSNSIREMKRFIKKVHKMKRNINNSAYLGDLLVTGYSTFSRNRMFGNMIGKGYTVKSAILEMSMVAEGYYATKSAFKIKEKNGAVTPIIDSVYSILYKEKNPKKIFEKLTKKLN